MSIVEKALQKMQQRPQPAGASPQPKVFGAVVPAERTHDEGHHSAPPPGKIIEINEGALRSSGLLPPAHQARQIAQQYRQIKRPLIANAIGTEGAPLRDGHLIMLASANAGEGKTFTSINLAFSMALEQDIQVLLIDADVAKRHISRLFGLDNEPGLMDALRDPLADVESFVLPTSVTNLFVLPAGHPSEQATELLASIRMQEVVRRIGARDKHRVALFDSPPLLLTTESHALAGVMGQVVLVVRADTTSHQAVLDALSHLGEGKSVSVMLNQSVRAAQDGYYYYYGSDPQAATG